MKRTVVPYLRLLSLVAGAALGACGESTGVDVELSDVEAAALAEAVMQAAIFATSNGTAGPALASGPQAAPYSSESNVSFTTECLLGGTVDVDGSVEASGDDETGEGRIELSVTHDHDGCMVASDDGVVFTFDGAPALSLDLVIESDGQSELGWSGTIGGAVDWATDEREGRCTIALAFAGLVSDVENAIEISVEGAVCQRSVELSWSLAVEDPGAV
jgi:hypothetical protein